MAKSKCVQLLDHFKDSLNKMANRPVHLKDFASQVSILTSMKEDEKNIFKATSQVEQMYNLLQHYEVVVPSEDIVLHEDLHEKIVEYKKEMDSSLSHKENKLGEMIASVDVNIVKLQDQIGVVVDSLQNEMYVGSEYFYEYTKVLEELAVLQSKFDSCEQLAKTYSGYQRLFNVDEFNRSDLEAGKEKIDAMKSMWDIVMKWNEKYNNWMENQFLVLQVEEMDKEVQQSFKEAFAINKKLPCTNLLINTLFLTFILTYPLTYRQSE